MAPLKLEDNIREQFENREIKPSADAWKKLADKLDQNQKPKRSFGVWWAIAAGIAVLALLGTLLFNSDPAQQQNEMVVEQAEQPATPDIQPQEVEQIIAVENEQEVAIEEEAPITPIVEEEKKIIEQQAPVESVVAEVEKVEDLQEIESKEIQLMENPVKDAVAVTDLNDSQQTNQPKSDFETKVDEVVKKIQDLEATNSAVSEEEIADLLEQAQQELKAKSRINMETLKVDANALLSDVEFDLERSFRDKVFDALGDGYNKIRTAMATRNN